MSHPSSAVPYASRAESNPLWALFRLGLILWASVTLLRHGLYWSGYFIGAYTSPLSRATEIRSIALAAIEIVLLTLILVAAIGSPRGTRRRFAVLGGLGGAFVFIVAIGALIDAYSGWTGPASTLRVGWSIVAKLQVTVIPLLCLIGLARGVGEPE